MLEKDFILNNTRRLLNEYINPIIEKADKPRKKFLRQAIGAILVSSSLIVTEFSCFIHDDCSDIFYRVKRLLNHLISPHGDLADAVHAYRKSVSAYIQPDTPIIIDLTDLAKPRARKMKYLAQVRDGSEHKLVTGYDDASNAVNSELDLPETKIYVCQICGNTVKGEVPDKCPICNATKDKFIEIH